MKEDKQLLVITHLSQLLDFVTGIGGFIVQLVLWYTKKDASLSEWMSHGKAILNFRISMFIYLFNLYSCRNFIIWYRNSRFYNNRNFLPNIPNYKC